MGPEVRFLTPGGNRINAELRTLGACPGLAPIRFSLPRVLGGSGIVTTLQSTLDAQESAALQRSTGILNEAAAALPLWRSGGAVNSHKDTCRAGRRSAG